MNTAKPRATPLLILTFFMSCGAAKAVPIWPIYNTSPGTGIMSVSMFHARDENSTVSLAVGSKGIAAEKYNIPYLENRNTVVFTPQDVRLRTGISGQRVGITLHGDWYWGKQKTEFCKLSQSRTSTTWAINAFTGCADPYPNTVITVTFSGPQ